MIARMRAGVSISACCAHGGTSARRGDCPRPFSLPAGVVARLADRPGGRNVRILSGRRRARPRDTRESSCARAVVRLTMSSRDLGSRSVPMSGALVLNATYEPLCVVPLRRAVVLVLAEKGRRRRNRATGVMRSARTSIPVPTVVRLSRYVRVPYTARGAVDPPRGARSRPARLRLLRPARRHHRPRPSPIARWRTHMDERRLPPAPGATTARAIACSPNSVGTWSQHLLGHRQRWLLFWVGPNAIRPGSATCPWTGRAPKPASA